MIGVGFAWSSILSAPYSILSGALPARKMGVYMGIFNFFIVIPQLLAATMLGLLLKAFFGGEAIWALVLGAGVDAGRRRLRVPGPRRGRAQGASAPPVSRSASKPDPRPYRRRHFTR
jgi:MFS family permease